MHAAEPKFNVYFASALTQSITYPSNTSISFIVA